MAVQPFAHYYERHSNMNIIKQGDNKVTRMISKNKLSAEAKYRLSLFIYLYSENGRYLIQNTLSLEITELTKSEWKAIQIIKSAPVDHSFIVENNLEQLAVSRYIVETDYDDIAKYQQVLFIYKTIAGESEGYKYYNIFPTTGCNARCVYCFEEGFKVKTMTKETADRLIDHICETRWDKTVKLGWFGGEPLVGANIIHYICSVLKERGVPFKSDMVTNASLMTKELAHEAKELWHLETVQVSLDGVEDDYTSRKNYYSPDKHNYDVVMQAIRYMADEGIRVTLRVNVDFENIIRIPEFLREIKARFGDMNNICLYFVPLYQEREKDTFMELYRKVFELFEFQAKLGIPRSLNNKKDVTLRVNRCMADSIDRSLVITPDGMFNSCEHLPEDRYYGNLFDGITDKDKYNELLAAPKIDEKCAKCPFLPECTPFYKNGCPGWFKYCYEYHCLKTEHKMRTLLNEPKADTTE